MRELIHDPKLLRDVLRNRLLRAAVSATSLLDRAARGRYSFSDDGHDFQAAVALARLGPRLVGELDSQEKPSEFWEVAMWVPEKIPFWEMMTPNSTREDFGEIWVRSYTTHGPTENYSTIAEARAYGEQRFDDPTVYRSPRTNSDVESTERGRAYQARIEESQENQEH